MITRIPSATASSLAFDVCPLGAEAASLSVEVLREGFLALDDHGQLDLGRVIKRQLRERLVERLDAQLSTAVVAALDGSLPAATRQPWRTVGG
ncbi:hypothetical protein [Pseudomonas oryzihabitans]|uniref:hypothetical protein n=1 Tax=Pseudomonas oryzihabitans TaxID=47885 RepID=UPI0011A7B548|nr:hypothetical protein [Pseudomonas psychrotolerans]